MFELFEGITLAEDPTPASMSDVDLLLQDARSRAGTTPERVDVLHWGRRDAAVLVSMSQHERELRPARYVYSGATGEFIAQRPGLGKAPSLGGAANEVVGALHFGNFAGTASKAIWFALAYCLAYVTLSGLLLWTHRRQDVPVWRRFGLVTTWIGYGLPATLVAVALAYFLARATDRAVYESMLTAYLGVAALAALLCATVKEPRRILLVATGVMMLALPCVRWLAGGASWLALADRDLVSVIGVDLAILVGGSLALRAALRSPWPPGPPVPASPVQAPAGTR
jgi:hypothetical protein